MTDRLPLQLYTAAHVRELDRIAIQDLDIEGYSLMQRAAGFSYGCLKQHWPEANSILIVCGGGNNAGDGYVLARLALQEGKQVTVSYLIEPDKLQGDARIAFDDLQATGCHPVSYNDSLLNEADIVVDAIFGTGLDRNIEGKFAEAIVAINDSLLPIMSIDIPSGLHADTGQILGVAVEADITPSFIGLKQGMFTNSGSDCCGTVLFDDLDVPEETYLRLGKYDVTRLDLEQLQSLLPRRQRNAHKGEFGHVLIVGGDSGFIGAARMAAEAAARVGAGLVSVATRAAHASIMSVMRPEIMAHGVETLNELMPLLKRANVVAIGPGLGQSDWARLLLGRVLESQLPLVIDADALNLLATDRRYSDQWVLTPHPGEAARLLDSDTRDIQANRYQAAVRLHEAFKGPVVLKGNGTVVADTEGQPSVCQAGNPGMASGGMGDVLTGVIAGLIAQGFTLDDAAKMGVCIHATAADRAVEVAGERGLLATDLMPHLRMLVNP